MKFKKICLLMFISSFIVACSDVTRTRYKDTSQLEMPPDMEIVEKPNVVVEEDQEIKNTGLGENVSFAGSAEKPVIKIKKLFDRSWSLVEQALKLSEIEITDKNREQGVFYVLFDPDAKSSKDTELIDSMTYFLFKDKYEEAAYKLKVVWRESATEVTAELLDTASMDLLDDQEDKEDFESSADTGSKLLKKLFKTIRDDLPMD